jgi:internalin A
MRKWISILFYVATFFPLLGFSQINYISQYLDSLYKANPSLEQLDLSNKGLNQFPSEVLKFKELRSLNLSGNQFVTYPKELKKLIYLETLVINDSKIASKHLNFKAYKNLKVVSFQNTFVGPSLRLSLGKNVKKLDLNQNKIKILRVNSSNLQQLSLESNQLQSLRVRRNDTVLNLMLARNQLSQLPRGVEKIKLNSLNLSSNSFTVIPELSRSKNLRTLILYQNKLDTLPRALPVWYPKLVELDFYYNQVSEIPGTYANLHNLERFYAAHNNLSKLPEKAMEWPNLKALYLHNNQLTDLPNWLDQFPKLEILGAQHNKINVFPQSVTKLKLLKELDMSYNEIESFPDLSATLPHLHLILIHGNLCKPGMQCYEPLNQWAELWKSKGKVVKF